MLPAGVKKIAKRKLALLLVLVLAPLIAGGTDSASASTGTTTLVSKAITDHPGNGNSCCAAMSSDGRFVASSSGATNLGPGDFNGDYDIYVFDRQTGAPSLVSISSGGAQGFLGSYAPSMSADGRFVSFETSSNNFVSGDTTYCGVLNCSDIFVRDRQNATTARMSVASSGVQGDEHSYHSSLSANGRYVAFYSYASNLVA